MRFVGYLKLVIGLRLKMRRRERRKWRLVAIETTAQRAVSRQRRTNDRSVLLVHEDHEDDENAENGVVQWSQSKTRVFPS